ncbi:cell division protein FtsB [Massilia arenosa]|uniref:Cell division protein FtsB n=1 Tax=Zemynaea arenosa TaxID=2561931 RepID=A0A4Y9STB7_9BURK|nr:cell division protein FtsB [Massilia arenosa]TFW30032.1 cell division protein FtsB [Massilia arenosa]
MRLIPLALAALLLLIQYPLWLGKGGWLHVKDMESQVAAVHQKNDELRARNAKLDSEVRDLKDGTEAVEERARVELGMIKQNEVFVQVVGPAPAGAPAASAPALPAAPAAGAAPIVQAPTQPAPAGH